MQPVAYASDLISLIEAPTAIGAAGKHLEPLMEQPERSFWHVLADDHLPIIICMFHQTGGIAVLTQRKWNACSTIIDILLNINLYLIF